MTLETTKVTIFGSTDFTTLHIFDESAMVAINDILANNYDNYEMKDIHENGKHIIVLNGIDSASFIDRAISYLD